MPSIPGEILNQLLNRNPVVHASTCVANLDFSPYSYDEGSIIGDLEVQFQKRGTYKYSGVPIDEFLNFAQSSSPGRYFNYYIRDRYSYERVD